MTTERIPTTNLTYYLIAYDADGNERSEPYGFEAGKIFNLESSRYIAQGNGPEGAHNDIAHPKVAHAIWQAAYLH